MDKKNLPLLTIGLPFFNSEKTLASSIKSVLIQTYTNWELFLMDDGSTDGSLRVAQEMAKADKRIKLISDGMNKGISYRLNQVIDLANGEYIARMDSDDMMMPEKIKMQMDILLLNKTIDVVDTEAYIINEKDEPVGIRRRQDIAAWDKKKVLTKGLLFHPTVIAKTSWYKKNKYDESYFRSQDFELWCRTFESTVFFRIYEPLFIYREGKVNVKNYTNSARAFRTILRIYDQGILTKKEFYWEIVKSYLKSFAYHTFALFNMHSALSSTRNLKLNTEQKNKIRELIDHIKNWSPQA